MIMSSDVFLSEDKRVIVSPGHYCSVASHKSLIYVANRNTVAIEIYGHSGDTLWGLRRIHTPFNRYDRINLWVNDKYIFASSFLNDALFYRHGVRGSGEAGRFVCPLMCHGDDDGDVLIADWGNRRLQVLHGDGHFPVVNIPDILHPRSAVYTSGRLYVIDEDSSLSSRSLVYIPDQILVENMQDE